jgi:murein DD-endopeptidase MepM/ murein hydrolase activator NlpD
MRTPWFSFGAVAVLTAVALLLVSTRNLEGAGASPAHNAARRSVPARAPEPDFGAPASLIIPVAGVARTALTDTWGAARAQGRVHEGIDILAPEGTPVLAAIDGRIAKFFDSERGGITIYEFDSSERFVFYYAHLLARAPNLAERYQVRQGQVIGYVGMTGNAPVPHLHFEVERLGPDRHWWQAESVNPYPLLIAGRAPSA